jgi:ATP-dependent 26S proteasome regulatory subunit
MRPGRLDRILWVGPPDQRGREEILRIKTEKMMVDPDLNVKRIAEMVNAVRILISDIDCFYTRRKVALVQKYRHFVRKLLFSQCKSI